MLTKPDRTDEEFNTSRGKCVLIGTREEAIEALRGITEAALDFETTALSPWHGNVRITSVCNDDTHFIIDHEFAGPLDAMLETMKDTTWYVYNGKFEANWLDQYCKYRADMDLEFIVHDVDFMAKAVIGGHHTSLGKMAKRDLQVTMDKTLQSSGWDEVALSQMQYDYAGFDSHVTWKIKEYWADQMNDGHWRGFHVLNDSTRATIEMEEEGLPLDVEYHREQIEIWNTKKETCERYLRKYAKPEHIKNLNSRIQVGKFIKKNFPAEVIERWPSTEKRGDLQLDRAYMTMAVNALSYPMNRWLSAYIGYTYHSKYLSTYGQPLLDNYADGRRVTARFNIAQARTGRYSSSQSNLQNIPRKIAVRRAFSLPKDSNQRLILADYSGIEVRVLAELSGDKGLLHDAIYKDVHTASASAIYGVTVEQLELWLENPTFRGKSEYYKAKAMRTAAKGFTFQLCIAEGQEVLTDRGLVPIQHVTKAMRVWDGVEWVSHGGAEYKGIKEVVTYDGFTATPDHRIFGADGEVYSLGNAMASGKVGQSSGDGTAPIAIGDNALYTDYYKEEHERHTVGLSMYSLWQEAKEVASQYIEWSVNQLLLPAQSRSRYGLSPNTNTCRALLCDERAVQATRYELAVLRAARDTQSVQGLRRLHTAYQRIVSIVNSGIIERVARRQDEQRRSLRAREYSPSDPNRKPVQQARVWDITNAGPRHRYTCEGKLVSNTYGAGTEALSVVLKCSVQEAEDAVIAWAAKYPRAYDYRNKMFDIMSKTGYLPVCDGREIYVFRDDRTMPVAANYPIQGAAASVMYRALYHVRKEFASRELSSKMCATVHDELLSVSSMHEATESMDAQLWGMERGWLDVFPNTDTNNLTDYAIGMDWSAKP